MGTAKRTSSGWCMYVILCSAISAIAWLLYAASISGKNSREAMTSVMRVSSGVWKQNIVEMASGDNEHVPVASQDTTHSMGGVAEQNELHSPFSVNDRHLGKEPFPSRITEFLRTAHRSAETPGAVCEKQQWHLHSNCPSWHWLSKYLGPNNEKRPAVFVDIGCNKGYSIASFYEQFAPTSGVNKQSLCKHHKEIDTPKYKGVCGDCKEIPVYGPGGGPPPMAFCIDGSPITHNRTKYLANILKKDQPLAGGWHLFHHAMTNISGNITYEDCSTEDCGIARPGDKFRVKKRWKTVPAMSYDDFAKQHSIEFSDLVKIDTEGEEPLIIQGMHESLKAKRVGFLAFEVHGTGKGWWRAFDMLRLVDLLDAYGYTCYIDTQKPAGLVLLTGCKGKRFQQSYVYDPGRVHVLPDWYAAIKGVIPQWGNAICGLRDNSEIRNILRSISNKAVNV